MQALGRCGEHGDTMNDPTVQDMQIFRIPEEATRAEDRCAFTSPAENIARRKELLCECMALLYSAPFVYLYEP